MATDVSVIVGSKTSPYVRRFRILLQGQPSITFKMIDYLNKPEDAAYLKSISPINKLPVLLEGENKVFESRVIANHLIKKLSLSPLSLAEENQLSMVDAANDVCVNLFMLRRGGLDLAGGNWYVERQKERLATTLQELEAWASTRDEKNPAHWNYVTMSLYSFVDWAMFREMADFSSTPALVEFVTRFGSKPGVQETSPRL